MPRPLTTDADDDAMTTATSYSTDSNNTHSSPGITPDGRQTESMQDAMNRSNIDGSGNSPCRGSSNGGGDGLIRSIVILMAMEQEAKPFLEKHQLVENVRVFV